MAYATAKTRKQQVAAAGMVAAIHVGIGAALLATFAGVTGEIIERWVPDVHNIPIAPPPPPPPDIVDKQKPADTVITAPTPPRDLFPVNPGTLVIPDSGLTPAGPVVPGNGAGTGAALDPVPTPTASFAPRGARPKTNPGTWASTIDYPARDLRAGNEGTTAFRVTVGADGRVTECMIIRSSGHQGLDEATCAKVSKRARFEPATDSSGNPAPGSYANSIRWEIPE